MYHKDSKSFLLFGKQLNQIIAILQMVSDKNPDIQKLNDFIQYLSRITCISFSSDSIPITRFLRTTEFSKSSLGIECNAL